jgi:hypothetical protein
MVLGLAMSTQVMATTPSWLMPNVWSIGIQLAQWSVKERRQVYYVEVTAQGRDPHSAREQAFRMAVEHAMGSVISTDTRVQLGRLQRDDIIVYSSGFVDSYELVDQRSLGPDFQVKMRVWVSHNRLANRLLSESRTAGVVEGGRISAQIESFQHERGTADRLLESVLQDFPRRGFDLAVGHTRVSVDHGRQTQLQVPVTVSWSQHYISSMAEAIASINQRTNCREPGVFMQPRACDAPSRVVVGSATAHFDDLNTWRAINREMVMSRPQILMRILDTQNRVQYQDCFGVAELDHQVDTVSRRQAFVNTAGGNVTVSDRLTRTVNLLVPIDSNTSRTLDRVEVTVVRLQECPKSR